MAGAGAAKAVMRCSSVVSSSAHFVSMRWIAPHGTCQVDTRFTTSTPSWSTTTCGRHMIAHVRTAARMGVQTRRATPHRSLVATIAPTAAAMSTAMTTVITRPNTERNTALE